MKTIQCKKPNKKNNMCKVCERAREQEDKSNLFLPKESKDACNGFIYYPIKRTLIDEKN